MSSKPNEFDANERSPAVRSAPPWSSRFNPVGDLNLKLGTRLRAFDEELMIDPHSRVEAMVQTCSRALGYAVPLAALLLLCGALSGSF